MGKKETPQFEYVIELDGLTRSYGFGDTEFNALDEVDLKIKPGEFVVIMGPSGCGKTTLLNILGLIDQPSDGRYFLEGKEISDLTFRQKAKLRNSRIGLIFQNFNLISRLSVIDNVALPLLYAGVGKTRRLEKASKILSTFQLSEREYYMPWQISGGQVQRVAIARALVNDPAIILADEPTGNLDSRASHIIMEELLQLNQRGHTIVMVTHNPNLTSYANRVVTMLDGKIISNRDNDSGKELIDNAPEIELIEEEPEPKVTEIIVTPANPTLVGQIEPTDTESTNSTEDTEPVLVNKTVGKPTDEPEEVKESGNNEDEKDEPKMPKTKKKKNK